MADMNDTQDTSEASAGQQSDRFESQNLRTLSSVRRSSDDRLVAGVCAGVARHLNVDPIVMRIAVVALTFIGLSGLILYLAAWFLLPEDDADRSVAADWVNLDRNEEQFRAIGLFVAAVLAVVAVVGDSGWGLWWIGWWVLPLAFLFWLFVVRPRRRDEEIAAMSAVAPGTASSVQEHVDAYTAEKVAESLERRRLRALRRRESRALRRMTLSLVAIAVAVTLIVDRQIGVDGPTYIAAALLGVSIGCLIGTTWGRTGGLVGLGFLLALALAISSAVPDGRFGQQTRSPETLNDLPSSYRHGVGQFELDLSGFKDPDQLAGKTVRIEAGVGQTLVHLPDDVPVRLDARLRGGEISAFGREWGGRNNNVAVTDGDGRALTLVIDQRFGEVKVIRK
jgi:phage shock protein PspC (stress-responsive transcriptional regulator)